MGIEIVTPTAEDHVDQPPPVIEQQTTATPAPNGDERKERVQRRARKERHVDEDGDEDKDEDGRAGGQKTTKPLRELQVAEDKSIRDYLIDLGVDNSAVRIDIFRHEPDKVTDPKTGKTVRVNGHLESVKQFVDEEYIRERHGGGVYKLRINTPGADGKYHYFKQRELIVGGDPRLDHLPKNVDSPSMATVAAAGGAESPSIVKDVLNVMKDQLDKANERGKAPAPSGPDPMLMLLIEELRTANERKDAQVTELRREMAEMRNAKPEKTEGDAFKDGLVKQLLDGDSTRLNAVRIQYESELRQVKESALANENRLRDNFDRDMKRLDDAHKREVDFIKTSHDNQIAANARAHDAALASLKSSLETSKEVLNGQIAQLKRENETLREDMKELRGKKEKTPLEMAREYEVYQDVFGGGKDKDESTVEKIVSALPQAIEVAQGIIQKNKPAPAAPQQQQPQRPQLAKDAAGNTFQVRGNELIPVRKKGVKVQVAATAEGAPPQEVEIPAVDPEKLAGAISYLERAYSGNQDPDVVAQSAKPIIPEEIMQSIQTLGIDVFFAKVAKLPSASPLATQAGKNWIRKVGKALVGE